MEPVVFIIDDDDDIREELDTVLRDAGYKTQCYSRAAPFLESFHPELRGCLVLDDRMPEIGGSEVVQRLRQWLAVFPVILVTGFADVKLAVNNMQKGVFDLIEKPFAPDALVLSVSKALAFNRTVWEKSSEDAQNWSALQTLTPREKEVLELILDGHSSRTVGAKLGISPRTVDNHRVHIMSKLRAKSLGDLGRAVARAMTLFGHEGAVKTVGKSS